MSFFLLSYCCSLIFLLISRYFRNLGFRFSGMQDFLVGILVPDVSSLSRFNGLLAFETSGTTNTRTQRHILQDLNSQIHHRDDTFPTSWLLLKGSLNL